MNKPKQLYCVVTSNGKEPKKLRTLSIWYGRHSLAVHCTNLARSGVQMTNEEICQELPKVTEKIQQKGNTISLYCIRCGKEIVSHLISAEGNVNRGRKRINYVENLLHD